jgi:hypothetical protein
MACRRHETTDAVAERPGGQLALLALGKSSQLFLGTSIATGPLRERSGLTVARLSESRQ